MDSSCQQSPTPASAIFTEIFVLHSSHAQLQLIRACIYGWMGEEIGASPIASHWNKGKKSPHDEQTYLKELKQC